VPILRHLVVGVQVLPRGKRLSVAEYELLQRLQSGEHREKDSLIDQVGLIAAATGQQQQDEGRQPDHTRRGTFRFGGRRHHSSVANRNPHIPRRSADRQGWYIAVDANLFSGGKMVGAGTRGGLTVRWIGLTWCVVPAISAVLDVAAEWRAR